ncbi:hypothetical protein [Bradyrhizobium huanghuaihaiense]
MKLTAPRLLADPDVAASKLPEIASGIESVQDGRIFIELVSTNGRRLEILRDAAMYATTLPERSPLLAVNRSAVSVGPTAAFDPN